MNYRGGASLLNPKIILKLFGGGLFPFLGAYCKSKPNNIPWGLLV
jgi:hypothetical protein